MTSAAGIFPQYPTAAVVSVVFRGDDVLLVSRKYPPDLGMWGFPGGKIEFGESIEEASVRELLEETGVHGEFAGVVTAVDDYASNEDGKVLYHFILLAVLCTWKSGEPVPGDDAEDAGWFPVASLGNGELQLSRNVLAVAQRALLMAKTCQPSSQTDIRQIPPTTTTGRNTAAIHPAGIDAPSE